jgi:hypothetical protein
MTDGLRVPLDSQWRQISGFPNYWISQYGQVFSMKRKSLISQYRNQHGVLSVRMYSALTYAGARGYSRSVPKLVLEEFNHEIIGLPTVT